jgi:hypothetical protein
MITCLSPFRKREEVISQLHERICYDVICMSGTRSKYLDDVDQILSNIKPGTDTKPYQTSNPYLFSFFCEKWAKG